MKLPFDKVYCLHLAEDNERYELIKTQLEQLGITDQVEFWYTVKKPLTTFLGEQVKTLKGDYYDCVKRSVPNVYGSLFDCCYNHYSIIKQAYVRGLNSILLFEDDCVFIEDHFWKTLNALPETWDIIKFHSSFLIFQNVDVPIFIGKNNENSLVNTHNLSALCYAMTRNGMKMIIDKYEECFAPTDCILDDCIKHHPNNDNCYILAGNYLCNPAYGYGNKSNIVRNRKY